MRHSIEKLRKKGYYVSILDGALCPELSSFISEIGRAFNFPDYYGKNMDALDECINDLEWIQEENYALVVLRFDSFMKNETDDLKNSIWTFLENVRKEWASVPNYEGEDQYRNRAEFLIVKQ